MYETTDKGIKRINQVIQHEFSLLRQTVLTFDEINIVQTAVNEAYAMILREVRKIYLELANEAYRASAGRDGLFTMLFIDQFLYQYDPLTKYVFAHEWDRKRARTFEALVASKKKDFPKEIKNAMYNLTIQTTQYADEVTDTATLQGYVDAGIERVRWISEQDGRVCNECRSRNGRTYDVHKVPMKPHVRCRCYLLPAIKSSDDNIPTQQALKSD